MRFFVYFGETLRANGISHYGRQDSIGGSKARFSNTREQKLLASETKQNISVEAKRAIADRPYGRFSEDLI